MKTNVRDTSLLAYDSINLTKSQRQVVEFLMRHPNRDFTRAEISMFGNLPLQSVCGRVYELIDKQVVEERVRRGCRTSGKQAHPVRLKS